MENRIIALKQHLHRNKERNQILNFVYNEERNNIIQVGDELLQKYDLIVQNEEQPKITSKRFTKAYTHFQHKKYTSKVMYGYFNRTIEKGQKMDHKTSKSCTKNQKLTSHFEGYIAAIQEQIIPTKYLINKRPKDAGKEPPCDNKCRLCKTNVEDVIHTINCCPFKSAHYYLPMRHDMVAKTLYKEIIKKKHPKIEVLTSVSFKKMDTILIYSFTKVVHFQDQI